MNDVDELEALRTTIGHTAHELANVLGIALNYVTFLAEDLPPEPDHPAHSDLVPLDKATRRAVELVRRLQEEIGGGG